MPLHKKNELPIWQDNLSRGNIGAVKILQELFPEPGRLQFIYADLGDAKEVNCSCSETTVLFSYCYLTFTYSHNQNEQVRQIFSQNAFDAVMHFSAVAYVGESTLNPLK